MDLDCRTMLVPMLDIEREGTLRRLLTCLGDTRAARRIDRCQRSCGQGYLGCKQRLRNAVNVRIGLEPDAD